MLDRRNKLRSLDSFKKEMCSLIANQGEAIIHANYEDEAIMKKHIQRLVADASKTLSLLDVKELLRYKEEILEPGQRRMIVEAPKKEAEYRAARGKEIRKLNPRL